MIRHRRACASWAPRTGSSGAAAGGLDDLVVLRPVGQGVVGLVLDHARDDLGAGRVLQGEGDEAARRDLDGRDRLLERQPLGEDASEVAGPEVQPGGPALRHRCHPVGDDAGGPGVGGSEERSRGRTRLRLVGQVAGAGRLRGDLLEDVPQRLRGHGASVRGIGG